MSKEKRIQFVKVNKDDVFFSIMATKYDGKFIKNGPGYTFPYDKKWVLEAEWKRFQEEGIICTREIKLSSPVIDTASQTLPPVEIETRTIATQTQTTVVKTYKYDVPISFQKHYQKYVDLVDNIL